MRPCGATALPLIQTGTVSSWRSAGLFMAQSYTGPMAQLGPSPLVPAKLAFTGDGTPFSAAYDDVYHSAEGGIAQAQHVFLAGNGLPARWRGRRAFTILETGFGFGLSFLTTWQAWLEDPQRSTRLHFASIEKHPFRAEDLAVLLKESSEQKSQLI